MRMKRSRSLVLFHSDACGLFAERCAIRECLVTLIFRGMWSLLWCRGNPYPLATFIASTESPAPFGFHVCLLMQQCCGGRRICFRQHSSLQGKSVGSGFEVNIEGLLPPFQVPVPECRLY